MLAFHGRDSLRAVRLIISGSHNKEKNGTAQRPSLPLYWSDTIENIKN
jgi:hypothetical protein